MKRMNRQSSKKLINRLSSRKLLPIIVIIIIVVAGGGTAAGRKGRENAIQGDKATCKVRAGSPGQDHGGYGAGHEIDATRSHTEAV